MGRATSPRQVAEIDAWNEYLEACRAAGDCYVVVEAWAWERLLRRLENLEARLSR